jgi:hypothetical protein
MTFLTQVRRVPILGALVGCICLPLGSTIAFAQGTACTGAPPAPASAAASVTGQGSSSIPSEITVTWQGVPTTGPTAASTYIIEAGNTSGAANIAVFDTRSTRTSSEESATNGRYYVRVRAANACGRSAPSPEAVVNVAGTIPAGEPAAGIPVWYFGESAEGEAIGIGELRGTWGARPTGEIKIEGTFLGPDKTPVGTDSAYVFGRARRFVSSRVIDDTTLAAGERGCFLIFTDIPFVRVSEAFAKVSWSFAQLEALQGNVVTENLVQDADSSGQLVLRGQLRNAGSIQTYFNAIHVDLRTSDDEIGFCDFEFVQGSTVQVPGGITDTALAPGQIGSFINYSPAPRAEVANVNTWTTWEEADPLQPASTTRLLSWHRLVADVKSIPALDAKGRARMRNAAIDRLRTMINASDGRSSHVASAYGTASRRRVRPPAFGRFRSGT